MSVNITEGTGKVIGAETISSTEYQLVKLVDATAASVTRTGVAANPLQVSLANTGANGTALAVSMATNTPVGTVAHDGVDSGAPVKIGLKAEATLSTSTMVADGDRTDAYGDLDGAQIVRNQFPLGDLISERIADTTGTSTAFTNFGATASTRNYVTAISVYNSSASAGYLDIRDGTAGSILYTVALPAGGGAVMSSITPLFRSTANTALAYDVSAALTTVYISLSGFKSRV